MMDSAAQTSVEAVARLAAAGDADALFQLAAWRLAGSVLDRNLAEARELFRRSAMAGRLDAARAYIALVANGTGGDPDWSLAVGLLRELAAGDEHARRQLRLLDEMELAPDGTPSRRWPRRPVATDPEIGWLPGLLSPEECRYLVDVARPRTRPSTIIDPVSGRVEPHPIRTSWSAGFGPAHEDLVVRALNLRLAAATGTEVAQGEPLQLLRYAPGQQYRPHLDAVADTANQRILTVIVYLNDDYAGGATHFPALALRLRGRPGDALLFRNAQPDGRPHPRSKHAGEPVASGEKYICTRWIRSRPWNPLANA